MNRRPPRRLYGALAALLDMDFEILKNLVEDPNQVLLDL